MTQNTFKDYYMVLASLIWLILREQSLLRTAYKVLKDRSQMLEALRDNKVDAVFNADVRMLTEEARLEKRACTDASDKKR